MVQFLTNGKPFVVDGQSISRIRIRRGFWLGVDATRLINQKALTLAQTNRLRFKSKRSLSRCFKRALNARDERDVQFTSWWFACELSCERLFFWL